MHISMKPNVRDVNIPAGNPKIPPRAYHHGNLRATLVTEGLKAIAEHDRAEVSLRDLARRIGVSPNAVYRHFADKNALLAAMAAEGFRRLSAAGVTAEALVPADDAQGRLRAYGRTYIQNARENPALFRLMFTCRIDGDEELKSAAERAFAGLRESVARVTGRTLEDEVVQVGTLYAWSLVHGLSHLALDGRIAGDSDAAIDAVLRFAAR